MAHGRNDPILHPTVPIGADLTGLSPKDRSVLDILAQAVRLIDPIYRQQANQEDTTNTTTFESGRGFHFYPPGATREDIEEYVAGNPHERDSILSPFTRVVNSGFSFAAVPYTEVFPVEMQKIAKLLTAASEICSYPLFAEFLRARAVAFTTNVYTPSDTLWVTANDSPFELILGPYESYDDALFGVKRDMQGILGVVRADDTERVKRFQRYVGEFDAYLGERYGYSASPTLTPMIVVDEVIARGGPWYGFTTMACNLPNEREIQRTVGSKKVFFKNIIDAKMWHITAPIARQLFGMDKNEVTGDTILDVIVGHEASHGLTFNFDERDFADLHSPLEECKADVFGLLFLDFLRSKGVYSPEEVDRAIRLHLADCFRSMRRELTEAHAASAIIQINVLRNAELVLHPDSAEIKKSLVRTLWGLGDDLYKLSQSRDKELVKALIDRWAKLDQNLVDTLSNLVDIPVDIDPEFSV